MSATIQKEDNLLSVDDLCVHFGGIIALDRVSFGAKTGEILGLIGPNGAGKTTLFNCLSRIYPFTSGKIIFDNRELIAIPRHGIAHAGIGRTFQNLALFRSMSVANNLMVGLHSLTRSGFFSNAVRLPYVNGEEQSSARKVDAILSLLQLEEVSDKKIADLPFGTCKRVELGRALASEPKLLLLDEPACGLNHEEIASLSAIILKIRQQLNLTILLVEHHMQFVMGLSDRVIALNFGRVIADGTPQEVRRHPEVMRAYLGNGTPG